MRRRQRAADEAYEAQWANSAGKGIPLCRMSRPARALAIMQQTLPGQARITLTMTLRRSVKRASSKQTGARRSCILPS